MRRFFAWLAQTLAGSLVAILIASLTTWVLVRAERVFETEFYAIGGGGQIAYPEDIFQFARSEGFTIEFDPPELEQVGVCDYSSERGQSWWNLAMSYLQKYPTCFNLSRLGEKAIKVFPDTSPCTDLREENGSYWCQCPQPDHFEGG